MDWPAFLRFARGSEVGVRYIALFSSVGSSGCAALAFGTCGSGALGLPDLVNQSCPLPPAAVLGLDRH